MHAIKVNLPTNLKNAEIHIASDWHIGDKFCDENIINERINYIKEKENAFLILNGDIMNNATKTSVSDCYAEIYSPMEQIQKSVELLEPIKDKILCITSGNHEDRTYNKEGVDLMNIVSRQLGIHERYSKTGAVIFVRLGKARKSHGDKNRQVCYTIYAIHGTGGGRKEGAKAIRLADMASIIDADIYIHSHTHLPMVMRQAFIRVDVRNSSFAQVDKLFINTAAVLNYGGYGERIECKPASKETPILFLNGEKKEMRAKL